MAVVHSYVRFSTEDQLEGHSLQRQTEQAKAWCKKHKHTMSDLVFHDLGKSSFRGKKQKALQRFLQACEQGQAKPGDILLIEAIDRLSRKGIRETQSLVNQIFDHGVDIAIFMPIDKTYTAKGSENDIGMAVELAAFAFAAHVYSQNISQRAKEWHTARRRKAVENGTPIPAQLPSWVQRVDDRLVLIEYKATIIKLIFELTIGGLGAKLIIQELYKRGIETISGRKTWNETYIRKLVRGRDTMGEYQPHYIDKEGKRVPIGEAIPNYYPAAVDEKTWLAAQSAFDNRFVERGSSKEHLNLFAGLVFNIIDGHQMNVQTTVNNASRTNRRLVSAGHIRQQPNSSNLSLNFYTFELGVLKMLRELDSSTFDEANAKNLELISVRGDLAKKEERLQTLSDKLIDSDESLDALLPAIQRLKNEVKNLKERERKLSVKNTNNPSHHVESIKQWTDNAKGWTQVFEAMTDLTTKAEENGNRARLREAIKQLVERINVYPVKTGEARHNTVISLVEIVLRNGKTRCFALHRHHSLPFPDAYNPLADKAKKALNKLAKTMIDWASEIDVVSGVNLRKYQRTHTSAMFSFDVKNQKYIVVGAESLGGIDVNTLVGRRDGIIVQTVSQPPSWVD